LKYNSLSKILRRRLSQYPAFTTETRDAASLN
jgi:hypothetical protein